MKQIILPFALLALPIMAEAQMREAPRVFSEAEEIAIARSAAPDRISEDATVYTLRNDHYEMASAGTNGVTCFVSRSLPLSMEPICYDEEASRTVFPIEMRRVEMRLAGVAAEEIDRRIAEAIGTGELRVPTRPAMAYMMSPNQVLYANAETLVGSWYPHMHVYMPYVTAEQFGLGGTPGDAAPFVDNPGEPTANVIIKLREFVGQEQ